MRADSGEALLDPCPYHDGRDLVETLPPPRHLVPAVVLLVPRGGTDHQSLQGRDKVSQTNDWQSGTPRGYPAIRQSGVPRLSPHPGGARGRGLGEARERLEADEIPNSVRRQS